MDHSVSRLFYLFKKYTEQNCTPEERNEFIEMVKRDENALELNHLISNAVSVGETGFEINRERADEIFSNILSATSGDQSIDETVPMFASQKSDKIWWAAAVIIILVVGSGAYLILNKNTARHIANSPEGD